MSSRKFSNNTRFVTGLLLSRIDAFQLSQAANPFSQFSASVNVMSGLRFTLGFNVFSRRWDLEMKGAGVGLWSRGGVSVLVVFVSVAGAP